MPLPEPQASRIERVRAAMRAAGMDALYLNYGSNFQYVTGLDSPVSKRDPLWRHGMATCYAIR